MRRPLRILDSARKHRVKDEVIYRAVESPIYTFKLRDDPLKVALLAMDEEMRPLELVYVINDDGTVVVIHAMPASRAFLNRVRRARKES